MAEERNPYRRAARIRADRTTRPERGQAPGKAKGLRKLPADLHALADGREDRLRRPRKARDAILEDDGGRHVIPGVRNSESRIVYDRRVVALRKAAESDDADALAVGLYEAQCLGLWRARNITDFEAFAENVAGVQAERAQSLIGIAVARLGEVERPLPTEIVALWVRTEAALVQVAATAAVHVVIASDGPKLQLEVPAKPAARAVDALRAVAAGVAGLGKLLASGVEPPR